MAAGAKGCDEIDVIEVVVPNVKSESVVNGVVEESDVVSNGKSEYEMQDIVVHMLNNLKLNPMAKEFVPSSYNRDQIIFNNFVTADKMNMGGDGFRNNRRRGNNFNQSRRRMHSKSFRAQREDSIRRTVYVSDLDINITEEQLAALFSAYGQVVDCRVCGDPHSRLRFAFVEFADEYSAKASLCLCGTILGFSQLKVLPSKTAILPVNPTFLPRSENEREMCARTVYCTNIDKMVSQADVKFFFETRCGVVSRLRLLGDQVHSTRIGFVEFVMAESAILALDLCGEMLGSQPIRLFKNVDGCMSDPPKVLFFGGSDMGAATFSESPFKHRAEYNVAGSYVNVIDMLGILKRLLLEFETCWRLGAPGILL